MSLDGSANPFAPGGVQPPIAPVGTQIPAPDPLEGTDFPLEGTDFPFVGPYEYRRVGRRFKRDAEERRIRNAINDPSLRDLGKIGDTPVGRVDVRTDLMKQLEQASLPALLQTLLNPFSFAEEATNRVGGPPTFEGTPNRAANAFDAGDTQQGAFMGQLLQGFQNPSVNRPPNPIGAALQQSGGNPLLNFTFAQPPVPIESRQFGGPLDPEAATIVGEAGPEIITPATQGSQQVVPLTGSTAIPDTFADKPADNPGANAFPDPILNFNFSKGVPGNPPQTPLSTAIPDTFSDHPGPGPTLGSTPPSNQFGVGLPQVPSGGPALDQLTGFLDQLAQGGGVFNASSGAPAANTNLDAVLRPITERNIEFGLGALANRAPSTFNTAFQSQGIDLSRQALDDHNRAVAEGLIRGDANRVADASSQRQLAGSLAGAGVQGALGGLQNETQRELGLTGLVNNRNLGLLGLQNQRDLGFGGLDVQRELGIGNLLNQGFQNQTQRDLGLLGLAQGTDQFNATTGLAAQQQAFNQTVGPTIQLLLSALGQATPTGFQTFSPGGQVDTGGK